MNQQTAPTRAVGQVLSGQNQNVMHRDADQRVVFEFLADPTTHGIAGPVTRIDTHGACVFLAGCEVYKVKRAVSYPFMDFSTLERRRRACENEIAVNKENAPDIYLGVVPIVRDPQSRLHIGGMGVIVEWAVHLRRFDETHTLDILADRGDLSPELIPDLAAVVLKSHRRAPIRDGAPATAALMQQAKDTVTELSEAADMLCAPLVNKFGGAILERIRALEPLLKERGRLGKVRRCHGDLHLRNIVLMNRHPVLFDAIEFDEAIATCDVLYDLAFLLMDLWQRGLRHQANELLNRYLWSCDDTKDELAGLALLPAFMSLRAAIRAKVALALARIPSEHSEAAHAQARHYLAAACEFLEDRPIHLIGIGGLSGTGKTTVAGQAACLIGRAPGALILRSDIERKRLFHVGECERLTATAYDPEVTVTIYARLRELASTALRAGQSVIVDAVHLRQEERDALCDVARETGSSFAGLWLEGPIDLLQQRVPARRFDASDATPEVVLRQARRSAGIHDWRVLDASEPPDVLADKVAAVQLNAVNSKEPNQPLPASCDQ